MDIFFEIGYCVVDIVNCILAYRFFFGEKLKKDVAKYVSLFLWIIILQWINVCFLGIEKDFLDVIYGFGIAFVLGEGRVIRRLIIFFDSYIVSSIFISCFNYNICFLLNRDQQQMIQNPIYGMMINCTFLLLVIVFLLYKRITKKDNHSLVDFSTDQQILLSVALFCCMFIMSISQNFFHYSDMPLNVKNFFGILMSLLCTFFIIVLVWLSNSIRTRDLYMHERELADLRMLEQEKRFGIIQNSNEEIRKFKHDVKGHMIVLHNYVLQKDCEGAEEYLNKIGDKLESDGSRSYTGIVALDAIIDNYRKEMVSKEIEFNWDGTCRLSETDIDLFDLCTVFENILVNAIEACEKVSSNKVVSISVQIINSKVCIIEKNTMAGNLILDKEGRPVTTKTDKKNHGIGTKNIRDVVTKHDGMIKFTSEDGWFEIVLHI